MTSIIDGIFNKLVKYDKPWCNLLGIKNPYIDNYDYQLNNKIPMFDGVAYKKYPELHRIYDKLWIAKSQNIKCGLLSELKNKNDDELPKFPFFIKPKDGHKSAGSKGCHMINNKMELMYYIDYPNAMWSEYITEKEGMTDFVLYEGRIVYQQTSVYSRGNNVISDEWKYISANNKPSLVIERWLLKNIKNYNGIVNIQYRGNKIIEVGLRPARGGVYLKETRNKKVIENINRIYDNEGWEELDNKDTKFKSFYAFKAKSTTTPFLLLPYYFILIVLKYFNVSRFHEYYFEPLGSNSHMFYQFIHDDFDQGMKCKNILETSNYLLHFIFFAVIILIIYYRIFKKKWNNFLLLFLIVISSMKMLNTLNSQYGLWKIQKISMGIHT